MLVGYQQLLKKMDIVVTFSAGEINVICSDIEQSLRFYRDILGFHADYQEEGAWHLFLGDTRYLLLPVAPPASSDTPYCSVPGISFDLMVDDIKAAYTYLLGHDVRIERPLQEGGNHFFIRDPDGLVLEIVEKA